MDNHACILLRIKNTLWIQKKVTAVLRPLQAQNGWQLVVYRTDSEQEVQKQETLPSSDILQLRLQLPPKTPSATPVYNSWNITTTTTTTATYFRGRSAYHVYYYYRHYRGHLRLQSQELWEVSFQEPLILYKENQLPSTPSLLYYGYWT